MSAEDGRPPRRRAKKIDEAARPRDLKTKVKTAKGRKLSSTRWLQRQLNDPYVAEAKAKGYRSRAAFKLVELDDKFKLIAKGARILDLGAAPGGWIQVALERGAASVVGVDLLEVEPLDGATLLTLDASEPSAIAPILQALGGPADLVLSDMAAATTGVKSVDQDRTAALAEMAYQTATRTLRPGGAFVTKVFQGGAEADLLARLKADFETVRHVKPQSSRSESPELYLAALRFRARGTTSSPPRA